MERFRATFQEKTFGAIFSFPCNIAYLRSVWSQYFAKKRIAAVSEEKAGGRLQ